MSPQLQDKVAVVTGASSGLGEAIAIKFASFGAKMTLCGRDRQRLQSVLDKAVKISGGDQNRFLVAQGDLNEHRVRQEIVAKTVEKFGRLDILVANAGVSTNQELLSNATEESYDYILNTNVKSVFFLIQQAVPHLEKTRGNIVIISSILSTLVTPSATVYSISKAAIDHLTRYLAVDLGPKGIRVNGVNPGYVQTLILRVHGETIKNVNAKYKRSNAELTPLKGRSLTADDIAAATAFLASEAAGFITGENIKVDGGRSFTGLPVRDSRL